jgi:hypothetical protein
MRSDILASGLDNLYADRVDFVEKFTIMTYGRDSEEEIQKQLNAWAKAGFLRILKPLIECADMEPCVKLLSFIQPNPNRNQ